METTTVDAIITPEGYLDLPSKAEKNRFLKANKGDLYTIFRNCALAVLNCGVNIIDGKELLEKYNSFDICVDQVEGGIRLNLKNAPAHAFVDGKIIKGISEHLSSVLRDIIYMGEEVVNKPNIDLSSKEGITDTVFHILRNANVLKPKSYPNLVVCWGGHAISRNEYDYSKEVGYQLGLRGIDICTGCGLGAMKGPMKGAAVGHAKQRITTGHYIGISEPGIIAAESPNPIVNSLVIMPDIEKRLEAFVRIGHAIIAFPGGVGTAEEIFYILGLLLDPENSEVPIPLILTGPEEAKSYFEQIDQFIGQTLGKKAQKLYKIIVNDPVRVAHEIQKGLKRVRNFRKKNEDYPIGGYNSKCNTIWKWCNNRTSGRYARWPVRRLYF